jgi:hypothetical protein
MPLEGFGVDHPTRFALAEQVADGGDRLAHRLVLQAAQHEHRAGPLGLVDEAAQAALGMSRVTKMRSAGLLRWGAPGLHGAADLTALPGEGADVDAGSRALAAVGRLQFLRQCLGRCGAGRAAVGSWRPVREAGARL